MSLGFSVRLITFISDQPLKEQGKGSVTFSTMMALISGDKVAMQAVHYYKLAVSFDNRLQVVGQGISSAAILSEDGVGLQVRKAGLQGVVLCKFISHYFKASGVIFAINVFLADAQLFGVDLHNTEPTPAIRHLAIKSFNVAEHWLSSELWMGTTAVMNLISRSGSTFLILLITGKRRRSRKFLALSFSRCKYSSKSICHSGWFIIHL